MLAYKDLYDLINDGVFQQRIQYAAWVAAVAMLAEVPGTAARQQWAKHALKGSLDSDVLRNVAIQVSANPTIGAAGKACLDSDIQFVVSQIASGLAG